MNKLRKMITGAIAIVFASTAPLMAGSDDFAGPFIAVSAGSIGAELDGKYTDGDGTITKGTGGRIAQVGTIELGYSLPLGESFFVSVGATYTPGEAEISKADDAADAADITIKAEEFYSYYISPSVSVTENSAVFFKYGEAEADLKVTGNFTGTAPSELSGTTMSLGTKTMFPSGLFFSAEAGVSEYDNIKVTDIGTADSDPGGQKGDAEADPSIAFGLFTVGYKF